jgi:hypothetical protein
MSVSIVTRIIFQQEGMFKNSVATPAGRNPTIDIPIMLTPHSGDVDPSVDFGLKNEILTKLQFFS